MAYSLVSSTEQNGVGNETSTQSFTFSISGDLLVVFISTTTSISRNPTTITWNSIEMNYVTVERTTPITQRVTIAWLINPANGSNTLNYNTSTNIGGTETISIMPAWYNGALQNQSTIKDLDANAEGSTDPSIGPITPSENDELVFAGYASEANTVLTIGAWADAELQNHDFGPRVTGCGYKIQTTATPITATWTGADDTWIGIMASFKVASGVSVPDIKYSPIPHNLRIRPPMVAY